MVFLLHGVVMVEVQKHHLLTVNIEEIVDVVQAVAHLVPEQPVNEVDLVARFARLRGHAKVEVANTALQLFLEGEILGHRPLLHHLFRQ